MIALTISHLAVPSTKNGSLIRSLGNAHLFLIFLCVFVKCTSCLWMQVLTVFRLDWDRWLMMGFIGFSVGIIGFLLHQTIDVIADFKWRHASELIDVSQLKLTMFSSCTTALRLIFQSGNLLEAWGFVLIYSSLFVFLSSSAVVVRNILISPFLQPFMKLL